MNPRPARTRALILVLTLLPMFGLLVLTSGRALMMGGGSVPSSRIAAPSQTRSLAKTSRPRPFTRPGAGGQFTPGGELSAALSPGSLFVPMIAATKAVDKATARQGETLTYTVTISNSGTDAATNVVFNDTIDANTTLVPNSLIVSPIAVNDAYTTIGNVSISVPAAQGLLANDFNPNGSGTLTVTNAGSFTTAGGGVVMLNADGSFAYNPAAGFHGPTDSFNYTLGNGTGKTDTAIVTITINGMIWFIDNSLAGNGDGRLSNPFNNLPSFAAINNPGANHPAAGDNIFLFRQVATNYAGPLTLLNNQKLIGQGATASLATITGLTPQSYSAPLPATGGTNPTIAASVNNITLASGNTLRGVTLSNSGGTALTGTNFGTFTAADDVVSNSSGPAINLTTGNLAATFIAVSSTNSTTTGINLSATTGSFSVTGVGSTAGSGGTIQGATNDGITLNNVTNVSFNLITVQNPGGHGISGVTVTGFSLTNSTITDTVNNATARDSVNFSGLFGTNTINTVSFNGINQDGISVTNSSGTLTNLTISNSTFQNHTAPNGNNSIQITANGNANMTTTITGGTFTHNGNAEEAVIVTTASNYTGTNNVTVQNATFNAGGAFGNGGIVMQADGTGTGNYRALNNTINLTPFTGIAVQASGNSTVNGVVTGNNITPRPAASGGNSGDGIIALSDGIGGTTAQRLNVSIQNNTVGAGFGLEGIFVQLREGNASASLNLTLVNNNVGAPATALVDGIRVLSQDGGTLCARISSNTSAGSGGGVGIRAQRSVLGSTTFNLERGAAALASSPATVLSTNNPASTTAAAGTITVVENNTCAAAPTFAQVIEGGGGGQLAARALKGNSARAARQALSAFAAPVNDTLGNPLSKAAGRAMASRAGIATVSPAMAGETINKPLGTIPPGKSVTIMFQATISDPVTAGVTQVSNTGMVSGTGFTPVTTNAAVTAVLVPPTISKAFGAPTITVGGTTGLTFTITNPNSGTQLTGVSFTDPLPAGLLVATPNGLTGSCGGGTITAVAGSSTISLSGATLAAGTSCNFSVNAAGTTEGVKNNTTGAITSTQSGPGGTATASITVVTPPALAKAFGAATITVGGTTSLQFTITNQNTSLDFTGLSFTDSLPAGLTVVGGMTTACGGLLTTTAPDQISFTGGTLTAGTSCNFSMTVTGATAGVKNNTTSAITSANGGTGNTASASIAVIGPPTLAKVFGALTIPAGGTTSLQFTLTNPNPTIGLTGISFTDTLPAGLTVADATAAACGGTVTVTAPDQIGFAGGTLAGGASCDFSVTLTGATPGVKDNLTGNVTSNEGGTGGTASASLTVVGPPTIAKVFSATNVPLGGTTSLQFTLANPNPSVGLSGVAFLDNLPSGLVVATPNGLSGACGGAVTAVAGMDSIGLTGGAIAAGSACTITVNVTGTTGGVKNNLTDNVTSANGGIGNAASASLTVGGPPTISKAFGAATITVDGTTSLQFTITNPASNTTPLSGIGFTDALPTGLVVATPSGLTGSCGGGTIVAAEGSGAISLSGATLAANTSCNFSVNVTGTAPGVKNNLTSNVTSNEGGPGNAATASLTVIAPPTLSKAFGAPSILVAASTSLAFTVANPAANSVALTGIGFTDALPAGLVVATPNGLTGSCGGGTITAVAGSSTISLAGATLGAGTSCNFSVNVTGTSTGAKNNTTGAISSTESGAGATSNTATLNVVCPEITLDPATLPPGGVGVAYTATTITASGGTAPYTFSLSGDLPAGLTFTGGVLSGTPTAGGSFNFTITATDANGCTGSRAYTLVINRPPVLAPIGNKTVAWDSTLSFTATATDPDGDTLTFSLTGAPAGATINSTTGEFTWTPTIAQIGPHTFTVTVTDSGTPPLSASETITVTVTPKQPTLTLGLLYRSPDSPVLLLTAKLIDPVSGAPLANQTIRFMINQSMTTGTTDSSGVAVGGIRLDVPGPLPFKATFDGNDQLGPVTAETSFDFTFGGDGCRFAILPAAQTVEQGGGSGSLQVYASAGNCPWTAQSNASWITLNPPPGGAGQGSLSFTAAPNPGGARTGTITVAGLTFTLHQQGTGNPETIGIFRPAAAAFFLRNSNTAGLAEIAAVYGLPGDVPLVGDWNGDGVDTIGIHRDAFFLLRNANTGGAPEIVVNYGLADDLPVVGDWNGDGVDTIGVFRGGIFILRNTNTGGPGEITLSFGTTGDLPVAGDWDGDGRVTVGVYRPSDQLFFLSNSLTSGIAEVVVAAGAAGDQPVVGDWDGDGVRTVGVYSAAGIFSLWNTNSGGAADLIFGFGAAGDRPLAGDWDGLP